MSDLCRSIVLSVKVLGFHGPAHSNDTFTSMHKHLPLDTTCQSLACMLFLCENFEQFKTFEALIPPVRSVFTTARAPPVAMPLDSHDETMPLWVRTGLEDVSGRKRCGRHIIEGFRSQALSEEVFSSTTMSCKAVAGGRKVLDREIIRLIMVIDQTNARISHCFTDVLEQLRSTGLAFLGPSLGIAAWIWV